MHKYWNYTQRFSRVYQLNAFLSRHGHIWLQSNGKVQHGKLPSRFEGVSNTAGVDDTL